MAEIFEGALKWFDIKKGFGFLVVPNRPDVFLHKSRLDKRKVHALPPGTRIRCRCLETENGWRADKILDVHVPVPPTSGDWQRGTVKSFHFKEGYGFLVMPQLGADAFVHIETVRACGMLTMQPGQAVLAITACDYGRHHALAIRPAPQHDEESL